MKTPANPYVGPVSFTKEQALYGRDRELSDLMDLLIAERIVLLYSPTGAGKSSLLQAGLIPAMQRRGYKVHDKPVRVSTPGPSENRYSRSVMASLALPDRSLDGTLSQYLDKDPQGELLIFDQFEEIITVDPFNVVARQRFFEELGEALRARGRWALFAMREDYLARLDPYRAHVPTRFSNTFRLDLLSISISSDLLRNPGKSRLPPALEAIRKPALHAQPRVDFTVEAALKLAGNLCGVDCEKSVQHVADALAGHFVEPVQLQVVCKDLWEKLDDGTTQILPEHIQNVANIDDALGSFYATAVREAAEKLAEQSQEPLDLARKRQIAERTIRDWFGEKLINSQNLRAQVQKGDGLDSDTIDDLERKHLVRTETRTGTLTPWVELAHDRLKDPVRKNNADWYSRSLTTFQRRALQWHRESENKSDLLIVSREIRKAQAETGYEARFLAASQAARKTRLWKIWGGTAGAVVLFALAGFAAYKGRVASEELKSVNQFVAQGQVVEAFAASKDRPNDALAYLEQALKHDPSSVQARSWLSALILAEPRWLPVKTGEPFTKDPSLTVDHALGGAARILNGTKEKAVVQDFTVEAAAFRGDHLLTQAKNEDGATVWQQTWAPDTTPLAASGDISAVAFRDSQHLVAASDQLQEWDLSQQKASAKVIAVPTFTEILDLSADGNWAILRLDNTQAQVIGTDGKLGRIFPLSSDMLAILAPTGRYVATYGQDGKIQCWEAETGKPLSALTVAEPDLQGKPYYPQLAFSAGNSRVAVGSQRWVNVYSVENGKIVGPGAPFTNQLEGVALDPKGVILSVISSPGILLQYRVGTGARVASPIVDGSFLVDAHYSSDGARLLTRARVGARIWDPSTGLPLSTVLSDTDLNAVAFSPDGKFVATGNKAGEVRVRPVWIESSGQAEDLSLLADLAGAAGGQIMTPNSRVRHRNQADWLKEVARLREIAAKAPPHQPTVASFLRQYFRLDEH
ncbi:MAG TPA: AAA family ATPase [Bryobacteraceae bacterium]|nr:AAA family ATPase [Bryobacteraceae bacterium]